MLNSHPLPVTYQNYKRVGLGTEPDERSTARVLKLTVVVLISTAEHIQRQSPKNHDITVYPFKGRESMIGI